MRQWQVLVQLVPCLPLAAGGVVCLYQERRDLSGHIAATGGGQSHFVSESNRTVYTECRIWLIEPTSKPESCELVGRALLVADDSLLVQVPGEQQAAVFAEYTKNSPMPLSQTLVGHPKVLLLFNAASALSSVDLDYSCIPEYSEDEYDPSAIDALTTVGALLLMATLCCACMLYAVCLVRANRRLGQAIVSSRLLQYSEMAQKRRQEMEQRTVAELWALPVRAWSSAEGQQREQVECCLCLDVYESHHKIRILPCNHFFHQSCIDNWFHSKRYLPRTCPLCKRNPVPRLPMSPDEGAAPAGQPGLTVAEPSPAWGIPEQEPRHADVELAGDAGAADGTGGGSIAGAAIAEEAGAAAEVVAQSAASPSTYGCPHRRLLE